MVNVSGAKESLQIEHERLQQRIIELEQQIIQDRVQAEEALRASEERFRSLFERASVGMFRTIPEGRFISANPALAHMLAYDSPQDLIATVTNIGEQLYVNPADREAVLRSLLADGKSQLEIVFRRKDGSKITICLVAWATRRPDGTVQYLEGFIEDITERKYAEEQLRQSQALLRGFLDHLPAAARVVDTEGRYILVNHSFESLLGLPAEEIIGRTADDLLPADYASLVSTHDRQVLETGVPLEQEETSVYGDYLSIKFPIFDTQGNPYAVGDISTNITQRKRVEQDLLMFKTLVENAPDIIGMVRLDTGTLTYANPAHHQLLGYTQSLAGAPFTQVFVEDPDWMMDRVQKCIQQGVLAGSVRYKRRDGTSLPAHLSAFVVRDASGVPFAVVGIARDLTEQHQQEQERADLQQQLITAQQAAIRELSTPLIPIADRVLVMPLIGTIDTQRAQQVMETLLEGVATHHAETVILDITGVQVVDTQVANAFIMAAQAVKLLGARVIITGIQPPMAQTLVQLGVDLKSITTRNTLQSGIAAVLTLTRR